METSEADIKAADRGEAITQMEPLVLHSGSPHRGALTDLAVELAQRSAAFKSALPPSILTSLATLVRAMNCYYSNLIEGHDMHPVDIERAAPPVLPGRTCRALDAGPVPGEDWLIGLSFRFAVRTH